MEFQRRRGKRANTVSGVKNLESLLNPTKAKDPSQSRNYEKKPCSFFFSDPPTQNHQDTQ